MKLTSGDARALEKLLTTEISLCDEYFKALKQEYAAVVKLNPTVVEEVGAARGVIVEKLAAIRDERCLLVERLTGDPSSRVSEVVAVSASAADKKRLTPLIERLKGRLAVVDKETREFAQVLNFSLGLVNGEISLLWSATQPVTRGYNAFGTITEGVQPGPARSGSSLGKV